MAAMMIVAGAYAAPAVTTSSAAAPLITAESQLISALSDLGSVASSSFASGYTSLMQNIRPMAGPSNFSQVASGLTNLYAKHQNDPLGLAADLLLNGIAGPKDINVSVHKLSWNS